MQTDNVDFTFCSLVSRSLGEETYGTATHTDLYLLLEYSGPWEAKAFEESMLSEAVKAHINAALEAIPNAKILFIKSGPGLMEDQINFYIIHVAGKPPVQYLFQVEDYEQLLEIDIPSVLKQPEQYRDRILSDLLFTVCTNGRRDPCCAKYGLPTYLEFSEQSGLNVWQSTHVGGHRFAPNVFVFPYGILHGRLMPEEVRSFVEGYRQGKMNLEHYRGRTCYPKPAQAAEYFLRKETGELGVEDFRLIKSSSIAEDLWQVTFGDAARKKHYQVQVRRVVSDRQYLPGCRDEVTKPVIDFELGNVSEVRQ